MIDCITNLHAGSGDETYGIIDKRIQRDAATDYPAIHASSLKGALREFIKFTYGKWLTSTQQAQKENLISVQEFIKHIFGSEPDEATNTAQGNYIFFGAQVLSIPVRSNKRPYYNATSLGLLNEFVAFCSNVSATIQDASVLTSIQLASKGKPRVFEGIPTELILLESYPCEPSTLSETNLAVLQKHVGINPAIFNDENFSELLSHLPVIARNHLENGKSENLWYEEIVPRKSRFYFAIMTDTEDAHFKIFDELLTGSPVQIGANATVGYGYCNITKI